MVVTADALPVADRALVIARQGSDVYARRLLRPEQSGIIGLAAKRPTPDGVLEVSFEREVALHEVVGVLFQHRFSMSQGREEAAGIDAALLLNEIQVTYRVREDSATCWPYLDK